MIQELRRVERGESFDEQPMPDLDSEALDFRAASESFAPVRKLATRDLATLRLLTDYHGRMVPTVGGILFFGRGALIVHRMLALGLHSVISPRRCHNMRPGRLTQASSSRC